MTFISTVKTTRPLSSLTLPQETLGKLQTVANSLSTGITANSLLLTGDHSTSTAAAEAIAHETGRELLRIDLSVIVSRYIGETAKNLERIFAAVDPAQTILFFDEADALFGKRTDVQDAHDRYANSDISPLLQRIESFPGLVIFAATSSAAGTPAHKLFRNSIHLPK